MLANLFLFYQPFHSNILVAYCLQIQKRTKGLHEETVMALSQNNIIELI